MVSALHQLDLHVCDLLRGELRSQCRGSPRLHHFLNRDLAPPLVDWLWGDAELDWLLNTDELEELRLDSLPPGLVRP